MPRVEGSLKHGSIASSLVHKLFSWRKEPGNIQGLKTFISTMSSFYVIYTKHVPLTDNSVNSWRQRSCRSPFPSPSYQDSDSRHFYLMIDHGPGLPCLFFILLRLIVFVFLFDRCTIFFQAQLSNLCLPWVFSCGSLQEEAVRCSS